MVTSYQWKAQNPVANFSARQNSGTRLRCFRQVAGTSQFVIDPTRIQTSSLYDVSSATIWEVILEIIPSNLFVP